MKLSIRLAVLVASLLFQNMALALAPDSGRLVVFADKKDGEFKTDKSIKVGTSESLQGLKLVQSDQKIHACFVGTAESIKPILNTMISNSNKVEHKEDLKLKTFTSEGTKSPIDIDITSEENKSSYIRLKIDPC